MENNYQTENFLKDTLLTNKQGLIPQLEDISFRICEPDNRRAMGYFPENDPGCGMVRIIPENRDLKQFSRNIVFIPAYCH